MHLYLVRHGEAKKEEEDPERRLTDKGVSDSRRTAGFAKKHIKGMSEIFHSPKPRAQETAGIFAESIKPERGIDRADNLLPNDDPGLWAMRIAGMDEDIMIVGHLPFLGRLAGLLLCGDKEKEPVSFKTSGVVCMKRSESRSWAIEWMANPEMV